MTDRRFARAALLCGAVSLPVSLTPVAAQIQDGELGYIENGTLKLMWGPAFEAAQRSASREADTQRRDYERCRDGRSGSSFDVAGLGMSILRGSRVDLRQLYRPRPQVRPRADCGAAPGQLPSMATVRIVDANAAAGGRTNVLYRFTFRNPGDNPVPGSAALGGQCLNLMDSAGRLMPVRSASDPDPFGFANPYAANPVKDLEARATALRERVAEQQAAGSSARASLAGISNYNARGGECSTPPRAPLPPRPAGMSDTQIEDQATGACVDLMMRRHDPEKVLGALRSVRWDGMIASMRRYQAHPASCAGNSSGSFSQNNDFMIRAVCAYSDIACFGQLQTAIQQCVATVKQSCGGPVLAWERRVREIEAAPGAARAQCESARNAAATAGGDIDSLKSELRDVEAQLARARATRPAPRAIPLSQARCGG